MASGTQEEQAKAMAERIVVAIASGSPGDTNISVGVVVLACMNVAVHAIQTGNGIDTAQAVEALIGVAESMRQKITSN